jgi:hypothetical protein
LKIKEFAYNNSLKKILDQTQENNSGSINPSQSFLILFEGTDSNNLSEVESFSEFLKKNGKTIKLMSFIDSKGELIDFGMAVYNNSSLNWFGFPKEHIFRLLEASEFDVLINLNIEDKNHMHTLACKANAKFKISLPTKFPHNFTLIIDPKEKYRLRDVIDQIIVYFNLLAG